ncbi:ABC transporter permease [Azospirillum thermophilum]|uniref:ABC transporter permease n=1 Tax=Azospirillum thermophilum TaxID=2202148 RepID=UPI001FEA3703|nr:ABC transporter permease [Azospirillum thermophilum]
MPPSIPASPSGNRANERASPLPAQPAGGGQRHAAAGPGGGLAVRPLVGAWLDADPTAVSLLDRFEPPSAAHPLGTDELGRDVLVRLLYGGQVSLFVGVAAAVACALIGTAVGLVSGYAGGRLDDLLMRLTDALIALPLLPLLIVLGAIDPTRLGLPADLVGSENASLLRIVALVALFGWTTVARLVRGATLSARRRDYARAAVALGASGRRIMLTHILPNVAGPAVVATTLTVGNTILLESVLSFLGLGIQPPLPSWGNMLTNAQELVSAAPLLAVWPGC